MTGKPSDETALEAHFRFGRNWASYAELIGEREIAEAGKGLHKLLPPEVLAGRTFLDIGSGSGLHSLAAIRSGVARVLALDIDPDSTVTTRRTLTRFAGATPWTAETRSVFDLDARDIGTFDVVYSWGVLHHTGDMMRAIERAASLVAPGGRFAFALYRRTRLDWFWVREKRWYKGASPRGQAIAQGVYTGAFRAASFLSGRTANPTRGMEYRHDLHDWLGGYPYESILADEVDVLMRRLGLVRQIALARPRELGLFGSGCDEYVYGRPA